MHDCAQTNIQLYNQLATAGYDEAALGEVRRAYDLAIRVFAGHYRPNHKPFLAHVVGTASILASLGEYADVLCAGLLHSAYELGDFGDGERGMTDARRQRVRDTVGAKAEEHVANYTRSEWSVQSLNDRCAEFDAMSEAERTVVRIKVADIFEEYVDHGICYSPGKRLHAANAADSDSVRTIEDLAARLGGHDWADQFAHAVAAPPNVRPNKALLTTDTCSFVTGPHASHEGTGRLRRRLVNFACKILPGWG